MVGSRWEGHNHQDAEATPEAGHGCRFKTRARVRLRAQLSPGPRSGSRRSARAVPAEAGNAPRRAEQAGGAQRDAGQGKKSGTSFCSNP